MRWRWRVSRLGGVSVLALNLSRSTGNSCSSHRTLEDAPFVSTSVDLARPLHPLRPDPPRHRHSHFLPCTLFCLFPHFLPLSFPLRLTLRIHYLDLDNRVRRSHLLQSTNCSLLSYTHPTKRSHYPSYKRRLFRSNSRLVPHGMRAPQDGREDRGFFGAGSGGWEGGGGAERRDREDGGEEDGESEVVEELQVAWSKLGGCEWSFSQTARRS